MFHIKNHAQHLICTEKTFETIQTQRYINDSEWMLTYESSEVIVNSNYMKNEVQRLFGLPYDKINVIPNGVNLQLFSNVNIDYDFRRQYAMDNEKIIQNFKTDILQMQRTIL